ncbi:MAG: type II secretion system F family protein [Acidimicrobiales bacterium]|nr:type II secretion system F family protein [Hyphomonadaceae bacterium]RZV44534.1 MAG: type II secretion system F family protein [Acidimicrobiales bacterium]
MIDILIYVGALGTVLLVLFSFYLLVGARDTALDRLQTTETGVGVTTSIRKDDPENKILKMLKPFQDKIANDDEETSSKRANLMQTAGFYNPSAQTVFYASRLTLSIILASATAAFLVVGPFTPDAAKSIAFVTVAAAIGYFFPLLYIISRIQERKLKFSEGLPDAMDMLLICLESGLSFPAAMKNVARELRDVHPVVSEQFEIATLEFQAGRKRSEALKNLAIRVDLPEVTSITTMIIQSDQLGTSLTRALKAAADDMRRDRMLKAEEKANALPAKMSVPLVLFIFPTLFCIIMVPVIVKIMRVL